jgi:crotonobetainyl-CoA:carnitine CoA-transferase CaiB-like acyl-CoA transferase
VRQRRNRSLLAAVALAAALLAGCGDDDGSSTTTATATEPPPAPTVVTDPTPSVAAAEAALAAIVERDRDDPGYHVEGIRTDPAIAPAFVSGVEVATEQAKQAGTPGLDFDPILCAQNLPESVRYRPGEPAHGQLRIVGIFRYGAGKPVKVVYHMVLDGETWKLNGTDCLEQAVGGEQ